VPTIDMSETVKYWARILGALALMKMATNLVRDAEKLISSTMKSRNPELADEMDGAPTIVEYEEEWVEPDGAEHSDNGAVHRPIPMIPTQEGETDASED